ncbi:MAG: glycosyltransferase family 2 protein [Planctomycetota bacterium]
MATIAAICLGLLALSAMEQLFAVVVFLKYCRKPAESLAGEEPAVMVVLPVRGADETLAECVSALVGQDYKNFRVRIILDSHTDPGWKIVDSVLELHPEAPIELLQLGTPRSTCSLKCSAVYEATEDVDDVDIVAFVDSDIVPHTTWLRELVAPLADEKIGVTHGNRWYLPTEYTWGSLVRYCWNAVAIVSMHIWQMPWGGTIAIKRRVLEETDIRQRWLRAGCEDVPLGVIVRQLKLKSKFVPSLILKDRESVSLPRCLPFIDRQLLWARLYHPACWWMNNVWQMLVTGALIGAASCAVFGLVAGGLSVAAMGLLALLVYGGFAIVLLRQVERAIVPNEVGPVAQSPLRTLLAVALTQVVMVRVIFVSLLTRRVHWRGIDYEVRGPWDLEMVEYRPYESPVAVEPTAGLTSVSSSV